MFEFVAVGALVMLAVGVTGLLVTGVVHVTVTADARRRHGPPSTRRPSDDGDRGLGTVDDSVADRAEEQPLEGASAPRADDDEPRLGGQVDQGHLGGAVLDAGRHR